MTVESVFAPGISGMGPALSPLGERIVNEKMANRDRALDSLEARGINVDVLAHRHRTNKGCSCAHGHGSAADSAGEREPATLEEALEVIRHQRSQIAHLEHRAAVQGNMVALLREALEEARGAKA